MRAPTWSTAPVSPPLSPEVEARLLTERTVWLTTLRPDGSPHTTPVWFVHEPGTWWIGSGERNVKVRNLSLDPRVSLALPDGDHPVVAEGVAHVHRGGFPQHVVRGFAAKYGGWDTTVPAHPGGAQVLVEVLVTRWLLTGAAQQSPRDR